MNDLEHNDAKPNHPIAADHIFGSTVAQNEQGAEVIKSIINWFEIAKPDPCAKDLVVQIGVHLEEVAEMLGAMGSRSGYIEYLSEAYKHNRVLDPTKINKVEVLDAICDQIVTAIGVGVMMGFDVFSALKEVDRSNWSKFVDGKPIFDECGKIMKGDGYSPPNIVGFTNKDRKNTTL